MEKEKSTSSLESKDETIQDFQLGDGLRLDIPSSKMEAILEIDVLSSEYYSVDEIYDFLQMNSIQEQFVIKEEIENIFKNNLFNQKISVARGTPPTDGEDGYIDWAIDLSILDGSKLVERKGRINFKERHHVLQVEEDQLLARMNPPTDGAYGKDIYDADVAPKPGKPIKFPAGKGVHISEDGSEMLSSIAGIVCKEGERISVSPTYTVQGNVSFKTGNINFDESVIITGDVMTDFTVNAGQDLHINGLVEGAKITVGGNLFIEGGIQGDEKAAIKAGGDITVKFINNAHVEANGDIYVNGPITQSTVIAKGKVILEENKGVIQGGYTAAEQQVLASVIGSEIGVKTQVELCREVALFRKRLKQNEDKETSLKANYRKLHQATQSLNKLRDQGKLSQEQAGLRLKIIRSGLQIQAQIKELSATNQVLKEQIQIAKKEHLGISAREKVWPGVVITIIGRQLPIKQPTTKPMYRFVGKEIEVFAYKEKENKKKET